MNTTLNPWLGKVILLCGMLAFFFIRLPHSRRSYATKVIFRRRPTTEVLLVSLVGVGLMLPIASLFLPAFALADYPLRPVPLAFGTIALAASIWLFHRSHVDLGLNWSTTLELREGHSLVTGGVYRHIRHPMYTAIFLFSIAQLLLLANWVGGPSLFLSFSVLFVFRVGAEEKMMLEHFGPEYDAYVHRTKRIIPLIW